MLIGTLVSTSVKPQRENGMNISFNIKIYTKAPRMYTKKQMSAPWLDLEGPYLNRINGSHCLSNIYTIVLNFQLIGAEMYTELIKLISYYELPFQIKYSLLLISYALKIILMFQILIDI